MALNKKKKFCRTPLSHRQLSYVRDRSKWKIPQGVIALRRPKPTAFRGYIAICCTFFMRKRCISAYWHKKLKYIIIFIWITFFVFFFFLVKKWFQKVLNWTFFKKSWQSFSNDTVTVFKCKDSQCWTGPLGLWDTVSVSVSVSVYLLSVQMVGQTTAAEASDGFSCDYVWMERFCPAQTELGGNVHRFFYFHSLLMMHRHIRRLRLWIIIFPTVARSWVVEAGLELSESGCWLVSCCSQAVRERLPGNAVKGN